MRFRAVSNTFEALKYDKKRWKIFYNARNIKKLKKDIITTLWKIWKNLDFILETSNEFNKTLSLL